MGRFGAPVEWRFFATFAVLAVWSLLVRAIGVAWATIGIVALAVAIWLLVSVVRRTR